ncbi:MAG: MlaE family lipid ABC transporter permease subunit [Proteobacteria bacterium]|nr:MlaE family lipid ABC transporter permease subunit [Pseudomonadota bacterium]
MARGTAQQPQYTVNIAGEPQGAVTLSVSGRITLDNLNAFTAQARAVFSDTSPAKLSVDLFGLSYLDSAGALALVQLEGEAQAKSISFQFINATDETNRMMNLIDRKALTMAPLISDRVTANLIEQIGEASVSFFSDIVMVITFLGELLRALMYSVLHPRSVRWNDVLFYMKRAGVDGLPIVSLISLLLGLIIAFMSSLQLKQFGANLYVASLVAVGMVRELGPIMTAILVAGRSGSAFAAEIGTMIVNEEVDALAVMGFDPIRFLTVPKVIASMLVVPLLSLYASLFGILGGLIIGVIGLDLSAYTYVRQSMDSIDTFGVVSSLIKSAVFAMIIAGIGCQRGFQVRGGAESVGASTTSAVVSAIFLIVVCDSAFAIILYYIQM